MIVLDFRPFRRVESASFTWNNDYDNNKKRAGNKQTKMLSQKMPNRFEIIG